MVDITTKDSTHRVAKAAATIKFNLEAFQAFINNESPKGNVIETARVAGIMAAKNTPAIIPFCHPLELGKARMDFQINESECEVLITAEVGYQGKTGVEMEALTAVSAAALTIYDMMKWADKGMVISNVMLLEKSGGKNGDFHRK
ncbi:MAG: cyclic pyranopterin monophosphate synthase MoaC [Candidatus Omnitrophica bacterium]|nr:cyclic pyranopterin monophosphate synthase MoaC [Candidatus Omnitrophota bacterium]MCB9746995.1 cyclic pyranopterin monophosphate synthase MoaC [Candidatus Omnitrophota bacterium]